MIKLNSVNLVLLLFFRWPSVQLFYSTAFFHKVHLNKEYKEIVYHCKKYITKQTNENILRCHRLCL